MNCQKRADADVDVLTLSGQLLTNQQVRIIAEYIPNVKKLVIKDSLFSPKIIEVCRKRFPKLQEITFTDTLEPVNQSEAVPPNIARAGRRTRYGLRHLTDPRYAYYRWLDGRTIENVPSRHHNAHSKAKCTAAQGAVLTDLMIRHGRPKLWYKRLIGSNTIQIEPPKDPDSKDSKTAS